MRKRYANSRCPTHVRLIPKYHSRCLTHVRPDPKCHFHLHARDLFSHHSVSLMFCAPWQLLDCNRNHWSRPLCNGLTVCKSTYCPCLSQRCLHCRSIMTTRSRPDRLCSGLTVANHTYRQCLCATLHSLQKYRDQPEQIVYVVDCSARMFDPTANEELDEETGEMVKRTTTPFQIAMKVIKNALASQIIAAPNHSVGMVFYNTACAWPMARLGKAEHSQDSTKRFVRRTKHPTTLRRGSGRTARMRQACMSSGMCRQSARTLSRRPKNG